MATPTMIPAGWYPDPVHRHQYRYWAGTDWTQMVSDNAVTATDPLQSMSPPPSLESPPPLPASPAPQRQAEPLRVTAPAVGRRRRRRWAIPVIAIVTVIAVVAVLGFILTKSPPPLLRPAGLTAGSSTTSSVTFYWSGPATGPAPDSYVILHDGRVIGSVPGTVTSYRIPGLAPATAYQYSVAAVRGGKRSALSAVLVVSTRHPARLGGPPAGAVDRRHQGGPRRCGLHRRHELDRIVVVVVQPEMRGRAVRDGALRCYQRAPIHGDPGPRRRGVRGDDQSRSVSLWIRFHVVAPSVHDEVRA